MLKPSTLANFVLTSGLAQFHLSFEPQAPVVRSNVLDLAHQLAAHLVVWLSQVSSDNEDEYEAKLKSSRALLRNFGAAAAHFGVTLHQAELYELLATVEPPPDAQEQVLAVIAAHVREIKEKQQSTVPAVAKA